MINPTPEQRRALELLTHARESGADFVTRAQLADFLGVPDRSARSVVAGLAACGFAVASTGHGYKLLTPAEVEGVARREYKRAGTIIRRVADLRKCAASDVAKQLQIEFE